MISFTESSQIGYCAPGYLRHVDVYLLSVLHEADIFPIATKILVKG